MWSIHLGRWGTTHQARPQAALSEVGPIASHCPARPPEIAGFAWLHGGSWREPGQGLRERSGFKSPVVRGLCFLGRLIRSLGGGQRAGGTSSLGRPHPVTQRQANIDYSHSGLKEREGTFPGYAAFPRSHHGPLMFICVEREIGVE